MKSKLMEWSVPESMEAKLEVASKILVIISALILSFSFRYVPRVMVEVGLIYGDF